MPQEMRRETEVLIYIIQKLPPEKLGGLLQFMQGVKFGLDMAGRPVAERDSA